MQALIYYVANPEPIVPFVFDADWSGIAREAVHVPISDARPIAGHLSLDEQGFVIDRLSTPPIDYLDAAQVGRQWLPAACALVQRLTKATAVLPWAVNVRFSDRSGLSRRTHVAAPARHVHTDFAPGFDPSGQPVFDAPTRAWLGITEGMPPLIQAAPRAWRCFNVWQQISPPPQDTPLALCDARTVAPDDMVIGRGRLNPRFDELSSSVDLSLFRRNPRHRWFYFSDMQPGETLVFCGLDPSAAPTYRMVPHIAFDDPQCPPDAPVRNSIEARVLAVFER